MKANQEHIEMATLNQLLERILQVAEARNLKQKDLARIAAFRPEDLSRMKRRSDAWVSDLDRLARHVGLKLVLVPSDELCEQIERKTLFARPPSPSNASRSMGAFGVRQNEKAADREAISRAVTSGEISIERSRVITSFVKNANKARIVRDWDGEPWHE